MNMLEFGNHRLGNDGVSVFYVTWLDLERVDDISDCLNRCEVQGGVIFLVSSFKVVYESCVNFRQFLYGVWTLPKVFYGFRMVTIGASIVCNDVSFLEVRLCR